MLKIYNTLTRKEEEFIPQEGKLVKMFVCGPTVYDYSHIGHARTYIFYDVLAKYLRRAGYEVFYLQNITDIDDKIIDRAKQSGKNPLELSRELTEIYYQDMKALGIDSVDKYAPATEYIPQIISQVERLLEKDFAYKIENDGYYFDLTKFPDYGKLSGRTIQAAEDAVSRIDESVNKRNKGDFSLWKFSKPGEPVWPSKLGNGRPGWHIEDTAITEKEFGPQYDLHGGALELVFPHHEAEIAQMEAISDKIPMVRYWVHSGVLTINGKKMAKSLGNFITIRDILKNHSPETLRFFSLSNHYRSPLDFSEESLKAAEAAVARIGEFKNKISSHNSRGQKPTAEQVDEIRALSQKIFQAMEDDFNVPEALGHFFELIRKVNSYENDGVDISRLQGLSAVIDFFDAVAGVVPKTAEISPEINKLVEIREKFRTDKDYQSADKLRRQIEEAGYTVDDTIYGPLIKRR